MLNYYWQNKMAIPYFTEDYTKGRFNVTLIDDNGSVQLSAYDLQMLLSGLDWRRPKNTG